MSYQSPIEINIVEPFIESIRTKTDEYVYQSILDIGVNVDKDELVKALAYDRDQYEKGYADGKLDAMPVTRCRECAWGRTVSESGEYVWCGKPFAPPWPSHVANWYCADGKRKEDAK